MKKIILIILSITLIMGCGKTSTAKDPVDLYLSSYKNLEYQVLVDMEKVISQEEDMNDSQKQEYRDILKKQYIDLQYEIISETYNEDYATIEVEIKVYDYALAKESSSTYLKENYNEFIVDEDYDPSLYMDYKLSLYKTMIDKVTYIIEFGVYKEDGIWKLDEISTTTLEKIHGIY